jgi:hypothetical protein
MGPTKNPGVNSGAGNISYNTLHGSIMFLSFDNSTTGVTRGAGSSFPGRMC